MQITMTKEEFDKAIEEANKKGQKAAYDKLDRAMTSAYEDMTKGFFSRVGREANIEMTRRFINIIREAEAKVK